MEEEIKTELCKWLGCSETESFNPDTDCNRQVSYGNKNTLLMEAIRLEKEIMVRYLLDHGATVRKTNDTGQGPFEIALSKGNHSIITMLLDSAKEFTSEMIEYININEIEIRADVINFLLKEMIARKIMVHLTSITSFLDVVSRLFPYPVEHQEIDQLIYQLPRFPEEIREEQRAALIKRFKDNNYNSHLYIPLINALLAYQDDRCLSGDRIGNTLNDLVCRLTLSVKANPVLQTEKERNGLLVNGKSPMSKGSLGEIYSDTFEGERIITKVEERFNKDVLQEAVINFCIINEFITMNPIRFPSLVPTYGFFLCEQEPEGFRNAAHFAQICTSPNGLGNKSHLYIVQKNIENTISFQDFLGTAAATLDSIKRIICIVFSQLQELQESQYGIYHGDLHGKNILVSPDGKNVYIIDWGLSGFTMNGKQYKGFSQKEYQDHFNDRSIITTGAIDFYFLLFIIFFSSPDVSIKKWASIMRKLLFKNKFVKSMDRDGNFIYIQDEDTATFNDGDKPFNCIKLGQQTTYGAPWLYQFLESTENLYTRVYVSADVHQKNVEVLNQLSYRYLLREMFTYDKSFEAIMKSVHTERGLGKKTRHKKSRINHKKKNKQSNKKNNKKNK